jgi:hypothetical protein
MSTEKCIRVIDTDGYPHLLDACDVKEIITWNGGSMGLYRQKENYIRKDGPGDYCFTIGNPAEFVRHHIDRHLTDDERKILREFDEQQANAFAIFLALVGILALFAFVCGAIVYMLHSIGVV